MKAKGKKRNNTYQQEKKWSENDFLLERLKYISMPLIVGKKSENEIK